MLPSYSEAGARAIGVARAHGMRLFGVSLLSPAGSSRGDLGSRCTQKRAGKVGRGSTRQVHNGQSCSSCPLLFPAPSPHPVPHMQSTTAASVSAEERVLSPYRCSRICAREERPKSPRAVNEHTDRGGETVPRTWLPADSSVQSEDMPPARGRRGACSPRPSRVRAAPVCQAGSSAVSRSRRY